jgi:uncharacterized protein (UPF0297 family)
MSNKINSNSGNINEQIVCINDTESFHITENNIYNILNIYKSHNNVQIFLIEDDGGYLNGYESTRFISRDIHRDNLLNDILN